jgi:hypothetical protein
VLLAQEFQNNFLSLDLALVFVLNHYYQVKTTNTFYKKNCEKSGFLVAELVA